MSMSVGAEPLHCLPVPVPGGSYRSFWAPAFRWGGLEQVLKGQVLKEHFRGEGRKAVCAECGQVAGRVRREPGQQEFLRISAQECYSAEEPEGLQAEQEAYSSAP